MATTINKTDGTVLSNLQDGAIDTTSSNLTLIGRLYRNYGELVNENFVKLLENFANSSSPTTPIIGQLWYNTSSGIMNVYRSTGFVSLAILTSSSAQPNIPKQGDLWFDTSDSQLKMYTGTEWIVVSPQFNSSQTKTGVFVETRRDVLNSNHICIVHYQQNSVVAMHCRDPEWIPQTAIGGFSSVKPGFNLAAINSQQFTGTASNALNLGNVEASNYLRNDISGTIDGSLTLANTGLTIGEFDDLQIYVDGANAFVAKPEGKISFLSGLTPILELNDTIQAKFADGTEASPGISFISESDTGIFKVDDNIMGLGVNGNTVLEVSSGGLFVYGSIQATNLSSNLNGNNVTVNNNLITDNLQVNNSTTLGSNSGDFVLIKASNITIPNGLIFSSADVTFNGQVKLGDILTSTNGTAPVQIDPSLEVLGDISASGDFNFANLLLSENGTILVNTNQAATGYYNQGDITLGNNVVDGFNRNNAIFARNVPKYVVVFNGSSPVIYKSHHVSNVTKTGTGVYVLTLRDDSSIDVPLISIYPEVVITVNGVGFGGYDVITNPSQTSITIRTYNSAGVATDFTRISVVIWDGDIV